MQCISRRIKPLQKADIGCVAGSRQCGLFAAIVGKFQSIGGRMAAFQKMDLKVCNRAKVRNPPFSAKFAFGSYPRYLLWSDTQTYRCDMDSNNTPYDLNSLELLAQIVDRARFDNGALTQVSRTDLSSDLTAVCQIFSATNEPLEQQVVNPWDMIEEEHPHPTRRYKIFAKALTFKDPLAALRELSRDRSPSEMYLLQVRINSRARSNLANVEKSLPKLDNADWSNLSRDQKKTIFRHIINLEHYYRRSESRTSNPTELRINEAVHELARIFSTYTHFDGLDTDLPYSPAGRYVGFVRIALAPFVESRKLTKDAISRRWGRIKGLDI